MLLAGAGLRLPLGTDARPRVPSKAQQSKRLRAAGAPPRELLFVLLVRAGLWMGLTRGSDLIIDSALILAWRRTDPDAACGHAPAHHPRPLLLGYRVHTLLCRGTSLPLLFQLTCANVHDAPFARPLLELAVRFLRLRRRVVRLDAGYWSLLLAAGVQISMDGRGRAHDNIFIERLWRTVKYEEVYLHEYASPREARLGLTRYLDFYNQQRPHQALDYRTPAEIYRRAGS